MSWSNMQNKKRDWPKILADLRTAGFLTYKVAVHVGCKWDTVKAWECGNSEPRYSQGITILEMYEETFGRTAGAEKEIVES